MSACFTEIPPPPPPFPAQQRLVSEAVTSQDIATVISRATGIPLSNLVQGERDRLLRMDEEIRNYVVGQDDAIHAVCDAVRMSRAGLNPPNRCVCVCACGCSCLSLRVCCACAHAC